MSDWTEDQEIQETDSQTSAGSEGLSPTGIAAMQGLETQSASEDSSDSDQDMVEIVDRPYINGPETLKNPEFEGRIIEVPAEDVEIQGREGSEGSIPSDIESEAPKPPEGWLPGGIEDGG